MIRLTHPFSEWTLETSILFPAHEPGNGLSPDAEPARALTLVSQSPEHQENAVASKLRSAWYFVTAALMGCWLQGWDCISVGVNTQEHCCGDAASVRSVLGLSRLFEITQKDVLSFFSNKENSV